MSPASSTLSKSPILPDEYARGVRDPAHVAAEIIGDMHRAWFGGNRQRYSDPAKPQAREGLEVSSVERDRRRTLFALAKAGDRAAIALLWQTYRCRLIPLPAHVRRS